MRRATESGSRARARRRTSRRGSRSPRRPSRWRSPDSGAPPSARRRRAARPRPGCRSRRGPAAAATRPRSSSAGRTRPRRPARCPRSPRTASRRRGSPSRTPARPAGWVALAEAAADGRPRHKWRRRLAAAASRTAPDRPPVEPGRAVAAAATRAVAPWGADAPRRAVLERSVAPAAGLACRPRAAPALAARLVAARLALGPCWLRRAAAAAAARRARDGAAARQLGHARAKLVDLLLLRLDDAQERIEPSRASCAPTPRPQSAERRG